MTKEEFETIEDGYILRHKESSNCYTVTYKTSKGYLGTDTAEIINHEEWDIVSKSINIH